MGRPHGLLGLFRASARDRGVTYLADEAIASIWLVANVVAVRLKSGGRIATGMVECALVGIRPRSRRWLGSNCPSAEEAHGFRGRLQDAPGRRRAHDRSIRPLFRPRDASTDRIQPPESDDPDTEDFEVEHPSSTRRFWPRLAARVPAMGGVESR